MLGWNLKSGRSWEFCKNNKHYRNTCINTELFTFKNFRIFTCFQKFLNACENRNYLGSNLTLLIKKEVDFWHSRPILEMLLWCRSENLPSLFITCCLKALLVISNILCILQNNTTSWQSSWKKPFTYTSLHNCKYFWRCVCVGGGWCLGNDYSKSNDIWTWGSTDYMLYFLASLNKII